MHLQGRGALEKIPSIRDARRQIHAMPAVARLKLGRLCGCQSTRRCVQRKKRSAAGPIQPSKWDEIPSGM